ncbi:uncharacterized protein LOC143066214 [Mytilus galloprovincialis]|uniref:uncharacterized protein LOC143066214 n=1 Tax=Mytilus galloprovincialis TaxID=29158 RepID=UPI003F7C4317
MRIGSMQFLQHHQVISFYSAFESNDGELNNEDEKESCPDQNFKSKKKKYNWRKWIIIIFVCSCLSVVAALIVQNEYGSKKETPDDPPTPSLIVDKCENDISTKTVGEPVCIPYTQQFTSYPSSIQVKQVSSQYFSALPSFSINVSSDTVSQKRKDWIINYNISRPDQPLRFMKENATCDSIGTYEITIEYDDGNVTSFEFEISFGDDGENVLLNAACILHGEAAHVNFRFVTTDRGSLNPLP